MCNIYNDPKQDKKKKIPQENKLPATDGLQSETEFLEALKKCHFLAIRESRLKPRFHFAPDIMAKYKWQWVWE